MAVALQKISASAKALKLAVAKFAISIALSTYKIQTEYGTIDESIWHSVSRRALYPEIMKFSKEKS
ncbi:hypothetical protein [Roseovarius spongiae]|uniref:hypothetical protein n=1 Tax=Roseovarius spongiae TaxID=2320272 RepID=UPI0011C342F5|nr:hypothetical protein [Roseovarius spongiae]